MLPLIYSQDIWGECTFKSALFSKELINPDNLISIDVQIPDSRKWALNSLKIVTNRTSNIPKKYKDNFTAKIKATYKFGVCNFDARIRQSGDWKDHIKLSEEGALLSSIDIKLSNGNILNSVRFKLLLPETRGSKNEILGSLILKYLNFITPETFLVQASINGSAGTFLFQENAAKELLERNARREGPIFQGDEKLIWSYKNFDNFDLENVSLAKLTNDNWAEKGSNSFIITLNAFQQIQRSYLQYTNSQLRKADEIILLDLNQEASRDFRNYALMLLAMNGSHGLRPHNRKFYFNAIEGKFEPIYYDGNLNLLKKITQFSENKNELNSFLASLNVKEIIKFNESLSREKDVATLKDSFLLRARNSSDSELFFKESLIQIKENLQTLIGISAKLKKLDQKTTEINISSHNYSFTNRLKENKLDTLIIEPISVAHGESSIWLYSSLESKKYKETISGRDMIHLISKNEWRNRHAILLPGLTDPKLTQDFLVQRSFLDGEILFSETMILNIDEGNKTIAINQTMPNDWILIKNTSLKGWSINFHGLPPVLENNSLQRFNIYGITGCLNFKNILFESSNINMSDGQCEDSINIMNSNGSLHAIEVTNSFSDGIDFDFSNIVIDSLSVNGSQNDCIDLSGGVYRVKNIFSAGCGDKGLSIGERSSFFGEHITVEDSNIGISSKDLSHAYITSMSGLSVKTCLEAIQKKQEFGGGLIKVKRINCDGSIFIDQFSVIDSGLASNEL